MDLDFSVDEKQFREEIRDWLSTNIPREARPREGTAMVEFDKAWMRTQYNAGWAGLAWPKEYGGKGLSLLQQLIWFEEYANLGGPEVGTFYVAVNHGGPTLAALGTDEQKAFYLPKILSGETVWCQGFSEPGSGSDLASLRTKAVVDGDHLVVNGQKIWTTYGQHARYQELLVRTGSVDSRHRGITWVICDMESDGVDVRPIQSIDGTPHFCEVFYNDVRIPLKNVVGEIDKGWTVTMATLGFERGTGLLYDQIQTHKIVDELIQLATTLPSACGRGTAIDNEKVRATLSTLKAEVMALKAMSYRSISRALRNQQGAEGTIVALYTCEMMQKVARTAMELLGQEGIVRPDRPHSLQQDYLLSFMHTIAGGTSEIRRNIIGERFLGLPRDR